jgi:hypothetical protein
MFGIKTLSHQTNEGTRHAATGLLPSLAELIALLATAPLQPYIRKPTSAIARLQPTEGAWAEARAKAELELLGERAGCRLGGGEAWRSGSRGVLLLSFSTVFVAGSA